MKFKLPYFLSSSVLLTVLGASSVSLAQDKTAIPPSKRQVLDQKQSIKTQAALKIINQWRGENPTKGERSLKIVYWSPNDRKPQPEHKTRLNKILLDIQGYYAKEMDRNGLGKLSINFDKTKDGNIEIIEVTGKHPYSHYKTASGGEILNESKETLLKRNIKADDETIVIFCNMANWDPEKRVITQNSPYYARGSAANGVAWQVDSAILKIEDLTNMKDRVRDGQYGDITLGKYNTIFIGGITHELGHAFGLPHNLQTREENQAYGIALMGSGNRAYGNERRKDGPPAFLTQASALRLATHPMFSGITKDMKTGVNYNYQDLKFASNGENNAIFKGKINSSIPCYAVVAFVDPKGGSDYDATTHVAIPDKDGNFSIECSAESFKRRGQNTNGLVRFVSYFANGSCTSNNAYARKGNIPYSFENKKLKLGQPNF